jgi:hypothetical protein
MLAKAMTMIFFDFFASSGVLMGGSAITSKGCFRPSPVVPASANNFTRGEAFDRR